MPDEGHDEAESLPETQPHPAPGFDTDTFPPVGQPGPDGPGRQGAQSGGSPESGPLPGSARPLTVPGQYQYLKWWQLVLVLLGVWIAAGAAGPALFSWWVHDRSPHKTPVVFAVLVYVVVSTVVALMLAMVPARPLVSALAIAVMSGPFASIAAAAPVYGAFYCDHSAGPCLMGILPY